MRRPLERMSPALAVAAIVLVASVVVGAYALGVETWKVMTDELLYARLGLSIGDQLSPFGSIHGEPSGVRSQLYPLLTAPIYQLFDMPSAFRAAHGLNAVLMASAAIPAYLLARAVELERWAAYLAAALAVATPWMAYSMTLFTEVAAYPAFLWAAFAIQRTLARPSPLADLLALLAVALAVYARSQFAVFAVALPLAVVAHEALWAAGRGRVPDGARATLVRAAKRHWVLVAAIALGALVLLVGPGVSTLAGSYGPAVEGELLPPGMLGQIADDLDQLAVGAGLLPVAVAAGWSAWATARATDKAEHAYAILLVIVAAALLTAVASFELRLVNGETQERYAFYLVPLFFVAMLCGAARARRVWPAVLVAGVTLALLLGLDSYGPETDFLYASPATGLYPLLSGRSLALGQLIGIDSLSTTTLLQIGAVVAVVAFALLARRFSAPTVTAVAGVAVLAWGVAATLYVLPKAQAESSGGPFASRTPLQTRDWIDDSVPDDARVGLVPTALVEDPLQSQILWWEAELFNKSVERSYSYLGAATFTPFPANTLTLDPETGALETDEELPYLAVRSSPVQFRMAGQTVVRSSIGPQSVIAPARPYRATWATEEVSAEGVLLSRSARMRLFAPVGNRPSSVRVRLEIEREGRRATATVRACPAPGRSRSVALYPRLASRFGGRVAPDRLRILGSSTSVGGRCSR